MGEVKEHAEARGATLDRMVRGGLSRYQAGASPEGEAEENHTTGRKNKGPEARASWASVAVVEGGGGLEEGQILHTAIRMAATPTRVCNSALEDLKRFHLSIYTLLSLNLRKAV